MAICDMCEETVPSDDVLELDGSMICAKCKPAALTRMRESGSAVDSPLAALDFVEFKKLRTANANIRVLGFYWAIAGGFTFVRTLPFYFSTDTGLYGLSVNALWVAGAVGAYTRKMWGHYLGMGLGALGLVTAILNAFHLGGMMSGRPSEVWSLGLSVPFSVFMSVVTFSAFRKKELFGPNRFESAEIREMWKVRKKTKT